MNKTETALTFTLAAFVMVMVMFTLTYQDNFDLKEKLTAKTEAITLLKEELRICEGR